MGKKSKAPSQPTTTTDMGQFGSTTTGSFGSTWKPTAFQEQYTNNAQDQMLNYSNDMGNTYQDLMNTYNNRQLTAEKLNEFNRNYQTQFQNNLLNPALSKGLLRGSTAQDVMSVANQNYVNNLQSAIDNEAARYQNLLNTQQAMKAGALGDYTTMYDIAKGVTGLSAAQNQAASNYALQQAQLNAQLGGGGSKFGNIASGAMSGAAAGSALGPWGALGGAVIGGAAGAMK